MKDENITTLNYFLLHVAISIVIPKSDIQVNRIIRLKLYLEYLFLFLKPHIFVVL